MAKVKTAYYCQNCGAQYSKWQGRCNSCGEWNTIVEEIVEKPTKKDWTSSAKTEAKRAAKPLRLNEIETAPQYRWKTGNNELDRVLGGGLVPGSLTLLGALKTGRKRPDNGVSARQCSCHILFSKLLEFVEDK